MPLFHIKMFFYVRKNSNKENGENIKKMEKILKFKKNDLSWIIIMLNSLKQKVFFFFTINSYLYIITTWLSY